MRVHPLETPRCRWLHPLLAALAASSSGVAWADEPTPWYVGASEAFTHDSNVYRAPNAQADSYASTALLGGFDQPVGRQRFYAAANVAYNKYRDQSTLDNTSYGVNAGWDWATIENLSGTLSAVANQSLASFDNNATVPLTTRNLLKTDQLGATARFGGAGIATLDAAYAHSRVRYSAPEYLSSTSNGDSASIGGSYRVDPDIRIGTGLRFTRTVSPYAVALVAAPAGLDDYQSNTSNGRNLDLTANWATTAQTGVNARLSWTRQTNSGASDRDFSGFTGALSGNYAPTAKLLFSASASRDAGTNASFFNFFGPTPTRAIQGLSENSQTTEAYALGVNYAATAKIAVTAGVQYSHAKLVDTTAIGGASSSTERSDNAHSVSLGATWAIARAWQLGCNALHYTRSLSGNTGFSYSGNTVSCSAQLTLR